MPKFGRRKIGNAAFELAKLKEGQRKKFGPRKFGARKAAIMDAQLAAAQAAVDEEKSPPQGDAPTTSVKQMATALGENPSHLDQFIELEKQRPAGVRKTAIKLFLGTEMQKEDAARQEVIDELQALLKKA